MYREAPETYICWTHPQPWRVVPNPGERSIVVDRGRFDAHLLCAGKIAGIHHFQRSQARAAVHQGDRWRVDFSWDAQSRGLSADFLVDASGRTGFLRATRQRDAAPTLALCGYIICPSEVLATRIEALHDGWCWGARLPSECYSVMVFLDPQPGRLGLVDLEARWRACLLRAGLFAQLAQLPLQGPIIARDTTSSFVRDPIGPRFVMVGEASQCLDPLSSTGVERALRAGLLAGITLHTMIQHPERNSLCQQFYLDWHRKSVEGHARWSAEFYSQVRRFADQPFWHSRSAAAAGREKLTVAADQTYAVRPLNRTSRVRLSIEAEIVDEACIVGDEIVARPALRHPALESPIAFIDGAEVGPLLDMLARTRSISELLEFY